MEKAEEGDVSLLFLDASHFVMGCGFLGRIYGRTRRFVMTFSGRMRYNALGAMDYVTKKVLVDVHGSVGLPFEDRTAVRTGPGLPSC